MARTALTAQKLSTKAGQVITLVAVDALNGMQVTHTGKEIVLLSAAAASSVNLNFPSTSCGHGRIGDIPGSIAAGQLKSFGPFGDPQIFGDGASLLFIDFGALVGTVQIAVITT